MIDVSVIMPTYGRPEFLSRAIHSVLSQSFGNWELIIVDDNNPNTASRDETEKIMLNYVNDPRIIYVKHSHNRNGSAARNTGLEIAKGKYISFLDDDDEYTVDRLKKCVDALENCRDTNIGGVYTGCKFIVNDKIYKKYKKTPSGNYLIDTLAAKFKSHSGSNLFFKASVVRELGGFDERFIRHQDYEFMVRFFEKYSLLGINEILLTKYENGANLPNFKKMADAKKLFLQKYSYLINDLSERSKNYIYYSHMIDLALMAQNVDDEMFDYYCAEARKYHAIKIIDNLRIIRKRRNKARKYEG